MATSSCVRKGFPKEKIDTLLNADAVEWCPYMNFQQFLICGTYKLQEANNTPVEEETQQREETTETENKQAQVRDGGVLVFSLENNASAESNPHLHAFASHAMCGVLDVKWPPSIGCNNKPMFGLVNAEGAVQLLHLDTSSKTVSTVAEEQLTDSSLGLSLDWARDSTWKLATSDSCGNLTVFSVADQLTQTDTWKAHGYEAWITAFHNTNHNILYSGGDDCLMKRWDLRDTSRPTLTSRRHQMGVCSIQCHPIKENIFASGSYDEELLIWDDRQMRSPLTSTNLGGGIWRIKWEPQNGSYILTATMYNGTHIVQTDDFGRDPLPIVGAYDDHNLAYGADWCRLKPSAHSDSAEASDFDDSNTNSVHNDERLDSNYLIATCSFYDHALHLWTWDEHENNTNTS